jgi:hypothetical protein
LNFRLFLNQFINFFDINNRTRRSLTTYNCVIYPSKPLLYIVYLIFARNDKIIKTVDKFYISIRPLQQGPANSDLGERFPKTIIRRLLSTLLIYRTLQNRLSGPHLFNYSDSDEFLFCFLTSMKAKKPKNNIDLIKIHHLTDHIHRTLIV